MMIFVGFSTSVSLCVSSYRHWIKFIGNFFSWKYTFLKSLAFYALLWKLIVVTHYTKSPVEGLLSLGTAREGEWKISVGLFSPYVRKAFIFLLSDGTYFPFSRYSDNVSMSAVLNSNVKLINILTDSFGQLQNRRGILQLESKHSWWEHKGSSNQSKKSASFNLFLTL